VFVIAPRNAGHLRWVLVLLVGCHASVGPVIGYSKRGGGRVGGELSGGFLPARGSIGATTGTGAGPFRGYATLEPGLALPASESPHAPARYVYPGGGLTLGLATRDEGDVPLAIGVWGSTSFMRSLESLDRYDAPSVVPVFSVAVGIRWLGGLSEVYVTPKIGIVAPDVLK
jgi:hypothetical protein